MLVVAGARLDIMALGALPALAAFAYLSTSGYHADRWGFLNPTGDIAGKNFQLFGSLSSLASGGWTGVGPGASKNKWGWVPEAHTDAIFAVIGEELGVIGSCAVIATFAVFIGAGMALARRTRDRFSMLVIVGLTALIGIQAFVNIGVTVGALPAKGFTLPFVSYGGSSMLTMLGSVGLIASMARDRR
jgi:cell division protein FtsW